MKQVILSLILLLTCMSCSKDDAVLLPKRSTLAVLAEEIAGGDLQSPTKNLYVARRQGNGVKDGAIIVLNNHNTDTLSITLNVNPDGFTDWSGQMLVNLLNPKETITVGNDGQATLSAPTRGYSIWVLKMER